MGCAGRIANGVNTVYCCYATPGGHALVGARIYVPADQLADPDRRAACGVGAEVSFRTKPQLALDICRDMVDDATMPPWVAGDEVYGRSGALRTFLEDNQIGYVMRVGRAFHVALMPGLGSARAEQMVTRYVGTDAWQVCSVTGSKGERAYAWAWIATTSPHHFLLIRKHLRTGELAYHYCHLPAGRSATLMTLVRVACLRWPVEEGLCATRRSAVFPAQPGGTWREVSGSDGLPGAERLRGQEHARKPATGLRRPGRCAGGPA
jgi:SRSO17 transposase